MKKQNIRPKKVLSFEDDLQLPDADEDIPPPNLQVQIPTSTVSEKNSLSGLQSFIETPVSDMSQTPVPFVEPLSAMKKEPSAYDWNTSLVTDIKLLGIPMSYLTTALPDGLGFTNKCLQMATTSSYP